MNKKMLVLLALVAVSGLAGCKRSHRPENAVEMPHGYTYSYNSLYDPLDWVFTSTPSRPNVVARQPFGLISIANADAAASPHTDAAILEAHRAVIEVLDRRAMPALAANP